MNKYLVCLLLVCCGMSTAIASTLKTVKYTITSKTSILAEGDELVGSMATFEQTGAGQKGQMTAGNSTTFTLTGLQGINLYRILLEMRSNQSSGAGSLLVSVGNKTLCAIPGAPFSDWYGTYTNSFVPITFEMEGGYTFLPIEEGGDGTTLEIYIEASFNSLYVASYTLVYSMEPPMPYTVQFQTNSEELVGSLTEETIGSGVVLPDCADADSVWYFKGWTMQTVQETDREENLPTIYAAGERFYPLGDTQLYALYTDNKNTMPDRWLQDTIFESGYYLIADSVFQQIAVGPVNSDGRIPASSIVLQEVTEERLHICPLAGYHDEMVYYIGFLPDSMATIQHVATERYIGYPTKSSTALITEKTFWNYRVMPLKQVVFYHMYDDVKREFRAMYNSNLTAHRWECTTTSSIYFANILFNIADAPITNIVIRYTSFPLGCDVDDVLMKYVSFASWGIVNDLCLPLSLYSLDGNLVMQTSADVVYSTLRQGYYLLGIEGVYHKIFVH